jgi:hypothetical protein
MAGLDRVPAPPTLLDATSTIGGAVAAKSSGGRQPVVTLGGGLIPRADYGVRTPVDLLVGLRADALHFDVLASAYPFVRSSGHTRPGAGPVAVIAAACVVRV